MKNTIFLICLFVLLPYIANAQVYDVLTTGEYIMGDSDTKFEARKIAIEHAKILAAEQIGTYLESEKIVVSGQLTKNEIRTYAAAVIKTTVLSEKLSILNDKTTAFRVNIKASVDIGVLEIKIKELKVDSKRKEQINTLQVENLRLLKELESLSEQLKNDKVVEYKTLRQRRESLLEKIELNQNSIRIAFEKGTLINIALKNKDTVSEYKNKIDDTFKFIAGNTKFTIGEPQVRYKNDTTDLLVNVEWQIENIDEVLNKISLFYENPRVDSSGDIRLLLQNFKGINADTLYEYCKSRKVYFNLEAGGLSQSDDIAIDQYDNIVTKNKRTFTFDNVPIDQLADITSLNAKIVFK